MDSKYGRGRLAVGQGSRKAFRLVLHALARHIYMHMDAWMNGRSSDEDAPPLGIHTMMVAFEGPLFLEERIERIDI